MSWCIHSHSTLEEIHRLQLYLATAYQEEEAFWFYKSRVKWLTKGDRNSRLYHACTKNCRVQNIIISIQNNQGIHVQGNKMISLEAERYFGELFSTQNPSNVDMALSNIDRVVTDEMNAFITRPVSVDEVRRSVFSIGSHRAPGPDGFTASFYRNYWDVVGPSLVQEVQLFFDTGSFSPGFNHTNLCLISKIDIPQTMKDFRPISLCNVTYKIL